MNYFFSAGDAPFYWPRNIQAFSWLPQIIDKTKGLGESVLPRLWVEYPFHLITKILFTLGFDWFFIEKVFWFGALTIGIIGSIKLSYYILGRTKFRFLTPLIYLSNTYILMVFGGGQVGVFIGYCILPFVLLSIMKTIDSISALDTRSRILKSVTNGILVSFLFMGDIRIGIIGICVGALYALLSFQKKLFKKMAGMVLVSAIVSFVIQLYWIIPNVTNRYTVPALGEEYIGAGMAKFLSFADLSHALSLLHPNWPSNLFGKVYFLQPEFLVLPLLSFGVLLFIDKVNKMDKKRILFFTLLGLFGVFLSKGANPPFGEIYLWCFSFIPGFVLFRDPSKFYILIALSYSILLPLTLLSVSKSIHLSNKKPIKMIIFVVFLVFWVVTVRQLWKGELGGNFQPKEVPKDYIRFMELLESDRQFSRTLYMPQAEQFAFKSENHPLFQANQLLKESSVAGIINFIQNQDLVGTLKTYTIGYVVVPEDSYKQFFLEDYTYTPNLREKLEKTLLDKGLIRLEGYTNLGVYVLP